MSSIFVPYCIIFSSRCSLMSVHKYTALFQKKTTVCRSCSVMASHLRCQAFLSSDLGEVVLSNVAVLRRTPRPTPGLAVLRSGSSDRRHVDRMRLPAESRLLSGMCLQLTALYCLLLLLSQGQIQSSSSRTASGCLWWQILEEERGKEGIMWRGQLQLTGHDE